MRKILVLITLVLLSLGGTALAQDVPPTFCGTLAESDCALLNQSAAAMRELHSAGFDFELGLSLAGIPDSKPDTMNFRMTGNGVYALDNSALSAMLLSPTDLMQNADQLPQLMEDALRAISADANIVLFFGEDTIEIMASSDTPLPEKAGFSIRLVDGMAYMNLSKLGSMIEDAKLPRGWFGFDMAAFYRQLLEQQTQALGATNPITQFDVYTPELMNQYMLIERLPDSTLNGQNVAVFQTRLDFAALLRSDQFQAYFRDLMTQTGGSVTETDLKQIMEIIEVIYGSLDFSITQSIGLDDHYTHQMALALDWPLDFNAFSGALNKGSAAQTDPIYIRMGMQATLDQFNAVAEITAPDDALILSQEDLDRFMRDLNFFPSTSF